MLFWGCTALGLSGAFGAYDELGVISHSGMEFLVFTTFLLGIFFCFCFSFLHSFFFFFPSIFIIC